jgi:hypothetical protein
MVQLFAVVRPGILKNVHFHILQPLIKLLLILALCDHYPYAVLQWHSRQSFGTFDRFHDLCCSCLVRGVSGEIPHCIDFQQNFEEGACLTIVSITHGFGVRMVGLQFNIIFVCFTADFNLQIH